MSQYSNFYLTLKSFRDPGGRGPLLISTVQWGGGGGGVVLCTSLTRIAMLAGFYT